jgi:hypothetical protein
MHSLQHCLDDYDKPGQGFPFLNMHGKVYRRGQDEGYVLGCINQNVHMNLPSIPLYDGMDYAGDSQDSTFYRM